MKLKNPIYYGVGALLLTAGIVGAQDGDRPRPPGGPGGDGAGRILEFLKKADADQDGKLTKDEFAAVSQRDTDERFARMDANGDGFVDKTEIGSIAEKMRGMAGRGRPDGAPGGAPKGDGGFRRAPDGDKPAGDKPAGRPDGDRPPGGRPDGAPGRPPGGPGGPGMGMNPDEIFGRMDANSDGNVDSEEYAAFSNREIEERFKRLDGDSSGTVSKAEFEAGIAKLRQAMGQRGPGGPGGPGQGRPGAERGGPPGAGGDAAGRGGFRRPPEGDAPKRPALEDESDKKPEA